MIYGVMTVRYMIQNKDGALDLSYFSLQETYLVRFQDSPQTWRIGQVARLKHLDRLFLVFYGSLAHKVERKSEELRETLQVRQGPR